MKIIGITLASLLLLAGIVGYFFLKKPPADNSIAILPFNYSGDSTSEYIANQFTKELYSKLTANSFQVISTDFTSQFKNTQLHDGQIASKLNVRFLVQGDINIKGDTITLQYHLDEPHAIKTIEVGEFTKTKKDINLIQSDLITEILHFVKINH